MMKSVLEAATSMLRSTGITTTITFKFIAKRTGISVHTEPSIPFLWPAQLTSMHGMPAARISQPCDVNQVQLPGSSSGRVCVQVANTTKFHSPKQSQRLKLQHSYLWKALDGADVRHQQRAGKLLR